MVAGWRDSFDGPGTPDAAPTGLQQQTTVREAGQTPTNLDGTPNRRWQDSFYSATPAAGQVAWETGGNIESIENGWNTPFYQKYFEQVDEAVAADDLYNLYDRDDFTGVVTRDQKTAKPGRENYEWGDVYEDGVKVGNLYAADSGYDKTSADWIMGRLTLDAKTMAESQSPELLSAELERVRADASRNAELGQSAREYQRRVEGQIASTNDAAADAGVVLSGAGGGAAVGAGIGSFFTPLGTLIGGGIGAVVGGVSAWLNRDEIVDQAARVIVQTEMATEDGNGSKAFTTALMGWSGIGLKQLSPVTNLTHGIYDVATDGFNDEAAWYAVDETTGESTRPGWVTALGYGAMVPDALGTFGGKAGLYAFQGLMSSTIAGQAGQMIVSGGETFDDRRGDFDNVFVNDDGEFDIVSSAAGVGNVLINVAQVGGVRGLFRAAADSQRVFGKATGEAITGTKVSVGGWTYTLDAAGVAQKRTLDLGILAPSEMLTGLSASMMARAAARASASGRASADDLYRMVQSLSNGRRAWTGTLVNATGEGYEEALQAVLEPVSHNADIDWTQVGDAAIGGTMMGLGMGAAAARQGATQEQRLRAEAARIRVASGLQPLSDAEWNKLSEVQKRAELAAPAAIREAVKAGTENVEADQTISLLANFRAPEVRHSEAIMAQQAAALNQAAPKTDLTFRITQTEDAFIPGNAVSASIGRIGALINSHAQGLELAASQETDPARRATMGLTAEQAKILSQVLERKITEFRMTTDPLNRSTIIDQVNATLGEWFNGQSEGNVDAELALARARATTLVFTRDPIDNAGSFQSLRPIVNSELSQYDSDNVIQVGHAILQPLGGDFDGDKIRLQARLVFSDDLFRQSRAGLNFVNVDGTVNIATRHYEEWEVTLFGDAWAQDAASPFHRAADASLSNLGRRLNERYSRLPRFKPILEQLILDLQTGNQKARENFLNTLSLEIGDEIQAMGQATLQNEWIFLDGVVQEELQRLQRMVAGRIPSKGINVEVAAPIEQTSTAYTRRQLAAATEGQTLAQALRGTEMFRLFQALRYGKERSNVLTNETGTSTPIRQLTETFNMLGEDMVESKLDELRRTDDLANRVQIKIDLLSRATGVPAAVLANAYAPAIEGGVDGQTVLQALLYDEIQEEKGRFAAVMEGNQQLQARLAKLEGMTRPSTKKSSRAGEAFVEVYRNMPLYELLGETSVTMGVDLTVGQYADVYFDLGTKGRRRTAELLRKPAEYLGRKDTTNVPYGSDEVQNGEVTGYRSVVDSILDYGNHRLRLVEGGKDDGLPKGALADASNTTGKAIREIVSGFQEALATYTGRQVRELNVANVRRFMEENPDWAQYVMGLIPNDAAAAFFRAKTDPTTGQTELYMAPWLLEAFTLEPAEAEVSILRNLIVLTYNAAGTGIDPDDERGRAAREYDRLPDRFHRILYRLANAGDGGLQLGQFISQMWEARDVDELIRNVNSQWIGDEAPYVAWVRDPAEFDADKSHGGWSQILPGAAEREAIATLKDKTLRLVDALQEERNIEVADAETYAGLVRARQAELSGTDVQGSPDAVLLQALREAINVASTRLTVLGPAAFETAAINAYLTFYANATDKGKNPTGFLPQGLRDAALDSFATNYEVTRGSLMSRDLDTVAMQPNLSARDAVFSTDVDGTPLLFPGLTEDFVIENWSKPEARSFILAMLVPSVQEISGDGTSLQQQYLIQPSLTALLQPQINGQSPMHEAIFHAGNEDLYAAYIESTSIFEENGRFSIQSLVSDLMLAHTSAATRPQDAEDAREVYREILRSVVRTLKAVGDLGDQPGGADALAKLQAQVTETLQSRYRKAALDFGEGPTADALRESFEIELAQARLEAVKLRESGDFDAYERSARQIELANAALQADPVTEAIALFGYDPSDPSAAMQRVRFQRIVELNPNLISKNVWAGDALLKLLNADGGMLLNADGSPRLTDKEWNLVSRAIIADFLEKVSGVQASDELTTPIFPDYRKQEEQYKLKYWDPTFAALYTPLFDPDSPLVQAAVKLHKAAHRASVQSVLKAGTEFERAFFPAEGFRATGTWTSDLPRVQVEGIERLRSSGASQKISMAGLAPSRYAGLDAAHERTFDKTRLDELVSTTPPIDVDTILNGHSIDTRVPVTLPTGETTSMPLAQFDGRFVSAVTLTLEDGTEVNLLDDDPLRPKLGQTWPNDPTGPTGKYLAITLAQLRRSLKATTKKSERKKAFVTVTLLHPESLPFDADQLHNVYFEGVSKQNPAADNARSLFSAQWVAPGGMSPIAQQEALQANKTGSYAIMLSTAFSSEQKQRLEIGWQLKLGAMVNRKARALMKVQNGAAPLDTSHFNSVYKDIKASTFVRGINVETGVPELWPADRVIDWQNQNPMVPISTVLNNAELWQPSESVLRRLYGDTRSQTEIAVMAEQPSVEIAVPRFTGTLSPAALAQVRGALTVDETGAWQTRDVLASYAGARRSRPQWRRKNSQTAAQQQKARQGLEVTRAHQEETWRARFELGKKLDTRALNQRAFDFASASRTRGKQTIDWQSTQFPWIPRKTVTEGDITHGLLQEYAEATTSNDRGIFWTFDENGSIPGGVVAGVLDGHTLEEGASPALRLTKGDPVAVNVDSFRGNMDTATQRLQMMMNRQAVIFLVSPSNLRNDQGIMAQYLLDSGAYKAVAGSSSVFEPVEATGYQNVRARESSLLEERPLSPQSMAIVLELPGLDVDENAIVPNNANNDLSGEVAGFVDLLPVLPFADFAPPTHPSTIIKVKTHIQNLDRAFLIRQSGAQSAQEVAEFELALDKLLNRWDSNPGDPGILPAGDWRRGDLVPLVRNTADGLAVLLYRHGNAAPSRAELEAALLVPEREGEGAASVAVYTPREQPNATIREGRIESVSQRSKYGLQAKLWTPLREFGNKIQLELNGMKYVVTTKSARIVKPKSSFFSNWDINYWTDIWSSNSKNAWTGRIDNHRWAFAFFGIDFEADLVEFFTGARKGETPTKPYGEAVTKTRSLLQLLSETLPKQDVRVLRRAATAGTLNTEIETILRDFMATAEGQQSDWLDRLQPNTEDAAADADRRAALAGIARATLLYLMAPVSTRQGEPQYAHVLKSGGFNNPGAQSSTLKSQLMAPLFTEFFDQMPLTHPTRVYINQKLNDQINNTSATEGYRLNGDFTVTSIVTDAEGNVANQTGRLRIAEIASSGDNPAVDTFSQERGDRQRVSLSTQNMASLIFGGHIAYDGDLAKVDAAFNRTGIVDFEDSSLWDLLQDVPTVEPTRRRELPNPAEQVYQTMADEVAVDYRQMVDFADWKRGHTKREFEANVAAAEKELTDVARIYGLKREQRYLLHHWVRQMLGMSKSPDPNAKEGRISFEKFMDAMADIRFNAEHGWLPIVDAEVPQIHFADLTALYNARERALVPLRTSLDSDDVAQEWSDWVQVALAFGETADAVFDPLYLTAVDGMLHSFYGQETSLVGLPVSRSALVQAKLYDPETRRLAMSIDPIRAATMGEPVILDAAYAQLGNMFGTVRMGSRWVDGLPPNAAIAKRRAARKKWRKQNDIASPVVTNIRNFREYGQQWVQEQTTTNALMRMLSDLRVGMALANPLLWVSAGLEMGVRSALDTTTNVLMGQSTGVVGEVQSRLGVNTYDVREQGVITRTIHALGSRPDFKGMIYGELMYHRERGGNGLPERITKGFAKAGAFMQDPTWGLPGSTMSRVYLDAVLQWIAANPTNTVISIDKLMANVMGDPTWVAKNIKPAHQAALASIANMRSLKQTPVSLFLRGIYEPLSRNPNLGVNTFGNLILRIPLMFSGYAANVGTTILGLQGASAMLATVLDGRRNPLAGIQRWMSGNPLEKGQDVNFDMSSVLEGLDLSKAFLQGAVTHTSLFVMGMLAGGLGLSGGDEEERRRKRAQMYQVGQIVYDPRDIVNDFRNADAVYLDWLPFGMGQLFAIPNPDGTNSSQSMAQLPWILRQFVSPILGMDRFMQTGDVRHIGWGFADAVGSMPLINVETWTDATNTFARLAASADQEQSEELDASLDAWGFIINGVAAYERMLFENSFVNMIYQYQDKYDRDPWKLPERDVNGDIIRPTLDQPMPSKALEEFVDPITGEVRMGSKDRDFWDATIHGFSENRATLAFMFSLFTGQGLSGDTIRTNMVPKIREIDKDELSVEESADLIMGLYSESGGADAMGSNSYIYSAFDASGREYLNETGARAVIEGIWKNSVQLGSPALNGVFISKETRKAIEAQMLTALIQEGVDLGLSEYDAKGRMYDIWYGPKDDPSVIGLQDIVWSDQIPYGPSEQYFQLNTTYVIGPDGRPWATGVTRDLLSSVFGLAPARYAAGDIGLGVDGSLNSVDAASDINTGMRSLEKIDDSWTVPTPEEIGEAIEEALQDALGKNYSAGSSSNGGYGYGYGRGGGGGYAYRVNSPERMDPIYARNIPYINVDTPILRRATIRRERFSSERGRLKPWQ